MGYEMRTVNVKDLPEWIRAGLRRVGYAKPSVGVTARESVSVVSYGGAGLRDFFLKISSVTGVGDLWLGSYGGPNPWSHNRVDGTDPRFLSATTEDRLTLDATTGAITGSQAGDAARYATVSVHPDVFNAVAPVKTNACTEDEHKIFRIYSVKAGEYRNDEMRRAFPCQHGSYCSRTVCQEARKPVIDAIVDSLVARGLLKKNKAGAVSFTTEGKNAARGPVYKPEVGDEMGIAIEVGALGGGK